MSGYARRGITRVEGFARRSRIRMDDKKGGRGLINGRAGQWLRRADGGPAAYYRTRATPCNARVLHFFFLSSVFFSLLFVCFFAWRTDRRSMAVFQVVTPSPPSRRERFLMTVILARKEGKGERKRMRGSRAVSSGSN